MTLRSAITAHPGRLGPTLLASLLLAMAPALQAGERATAPPASPYRLVSADGASSPDASPYLLDQSYRMESTASTDSATTVQLAAKPYARQINEAAREAGVDPALVHAVVSVESAYRSAAVSPKGAVGLMQVMPETALRYGVSDPAGVRDNLRAGARHLSALMERYDDRLDLALAAYNAGEGAVKRYNNTIPPYAETRHYVPAVIAKYQAARPALKKTSKRPTLVYLSGTRLESTY